MSFITKAIKTASQSNTLEINDNNNRPPCLKASHSNSSIEDPDEDDSRTSGISLGGRTPPPDGGWGWVVVFASFMISLILDGITLSSGTIFVELLDYFEQSKSKTSWVVSIILSMPLLIGPVASYLTDRYGCRLICIAGSVLATAGFVVSFFSHSLELLYFTFALTGFGLALCFVTSVVIVPYYFERRRGLATGLSVCGTGIGTFVFPPLISHLLDGYGWRGTFLILAGFFLNISVFGCLMRELDDDRSSETDDEEEDEERAGDTSDREEEFVGLDAINPRLCSSLVQFPTYLSGGEQQQHCLFQTVVRAGSPPECTLHPARVVPSSDHQQRRKVSKRWSRHSGWLSKSIAGQQQHTDYLRNLRLQRGSFTYRGAMLNLPKYRLRTSSCPDIFRNSMVTIAEDDKKCPFLHELKSSLLYIVDFSVFKNLRFTFFCISNFLLYACVDIPYVYLQDYAIDLGIDKEMASFLISILGILNTFGMVIVGYFGDKKWLNSAMLYGVFVVICGISMVIMPLLSSFSSMAVISAVYGFTISANYTLMSVIVVNIISLDNFTSAYGLLLLIQGIASLVGPPVAGWLYDVSGTYSVTFYSTGLAIVCSGLLMVPVAKPTCCRRLWSSSEEEEEPQPEHRSERVRFREDDATLTNGAI